MTYDENIIYDSNNRFLIKTYFSNASVRQNQFRVHHHAECELSLIISGNGIYRVKNKQYSFKNGDVFLFSGDEDHCITDIFSECKILNIHFSPRILWTDDDLSLSRIFFARSDNFENKLTPENPFTAKIAEAILETENELREKKDNYKTMAKYKILYTLTLLVRHYNYIDNSDNYNVYKSSIKPIKTALKYIDENITNDITLAQISSVAAISPAYFSSIFKKLNGISLWEYITIKRVDYAIELLKTTNMTKLDIAMKSGFNSSSNFYKAFTHVTGKTPSQFTKSI